MLTYASLDTSIIAQLTAIVGEDHLSTSDAQRELHARDQSFHAPHLPDVVVWPHHQRHVMEILQLANQHRIPVTPWGAGSSLEGNPIPTHGGILLNMTKLDYVIELHEDDFQVTVQPGVTRKDLNKLLAKYGLFFPPDPGANATIGGMIANNAAGIRTVKYGATKDNVLKMNVVLADGRFIRVGSRSVKQSAGYNLLQMFIGSEGTLGIVTEATLKLAPIPQYRTTMVVAFETVKAAIEAVVAIKGSGIDVAALEFLDDVAARMLIQSGLSMSPNPSLFMEVHNAHETAMQADIDIVREICEALDCTSFIPIQDNTQQSRLWEARHGAYETMVRMMPDKRLQVMDVAVPISQYPTIVAYGRQLMQEHNLSAAMIGHAGDGNIHFTLPYGDDDELAVVKAVNQAIIEKALSLDGTITGEHGVGMGKRAYMAAEHGTALDVMRTLKQTFDPNGILNPGKIIPDEVR